MRMMAAACALLVLAGGGCLKTVTMKTVVEADGSVDRLIRVESDGDGPTVAGDLKLPDKAGWQQYKSEDKFFEAHGKFKSVADIPLDFEKKVNNDDKEDKPFPETSKSVKSFRSLKCALFTIYTYTETITDVTSRDEFDKAIEKFIDLRTLAYEAAQKAYGEEFDLTDAKAYIEKEIVPRARGAAAAYWDARVNKQPGSERRMQESAVKLLKDLGVTVPDNDPDKIMDVATKWGLEKFAGLLRAKDGAKVTAEQAKDLVEKAKSNEKLQAAWKELIEKKFGGEEKFGEWGKEVFLRLVGAYFQFLSHGFEFRASVTMPGQVVETNGLIVDNAVEWFFTHESVFPGYEMRVRSIAFTRENELKGGGSLIASVKNALLLANFVESQKEPDAARLLSALDDLAKTHSTKALEALAAPPQGTPAIAGLSKLLEQLELVK